MRGLPAVRRAGLPGVLIQLHSRHDTPCTNKGIALCIVLGLEQFLVPRNPHTRFTQWLQGESRISSFSRQKGHVCLYRLQSKLLACQR